MSLPIFARGYPSLIMIKEFYNYHANISGNPTMEEKGKPEGRVTVRVPFDGFKFFTRFAYADTMAQYHERSDEQHALIGHLGFTGISPEDFWVAEERTSSRVVLPLNVPIPFESTQLSTLVEDRKMAVLKHTYTPKWPDVFPRPRPIRLVINLFDEHTMQERFGDSLQMTEWERISQELSFERSLFFAFHIELAVPKDIKVQDLPILRLAQLQWPVATSYHMLSLTVDPDGVSKLGDWPEHDLYYFPERGSVEWRDITFRSGTGQNGTQSHIGESAEGPKLYHAPVMLLRVHEPGELYQRPQLLCKLEVELPGVLLSSASPSYFNALGHLEKNQKITTSSHLLVDVEINLKQRFDRKMMSPHQHIQFEGVVLEDVRMNDIATLLRDLGFRVEPYLDLLTLLDDSRRRELERQNVRMYAITAQKTEGADEMRVWIFTRGTMAATERETIIPGGKSYKTTVTSGNTELDMHAEMRGDVRKLNRVMNTIHTSLKERFRHVSTIE